MSVHSVIDSFNIIATDQLGTALTTSSRLLSTTIWLYNPGALISRGGAAGFINYDLLLPDGTWLNPAQAYSITGYQFTIDDTSQLFKIAPLHTNPVYISTPTTYTASGLDDIFIIQGIRTRLNLTSIGTSPVKVMILAWEP